jgi:methyl-accepting chemotaxis protein
MKKKIFITSLAGFILILAGSLTAVLLEMSSIKSINTDGITEKLYNENNLIMSSIIHLIPPSSYESLKLPSSWAEIMTVNSDNLAILASTNKSNKGKYIYTIPGLLDQAKDILAQMKNMKPSVIRSKDYIVAVIPYQANTFIIGLKPKTWEKNLINTQFDEMNNMSSHIYRNLIILAVLGILISIVLSFLITLAVSGYLSEFSKSIKALSLGNLDAEPPVSKGKELAVFTESFIRIKTSLIMALQRLKDK